MKFNRSLFNAAVLVASLFSASIASARPFTCIAQNSSGITAKGTGRGLAPALAKRRAKEKSSERLLAEDKQ